MLNGLRAWNINAKFSYALIRQLAAKQYLAGVSMPAVQAYSFKRVSSGKGGSVWSTS